MTGYADAYFISVYAIANISDLCANAYIDDLYAIAYYGRPWTPLHARPNSLALEFGATAAGKAVIERYRAIEMDTAVAARKHLLALNRFRAAR